MSELHRALDAVERRVLGCLVEKELSTPDAYPLTGNALLAACNQSTNRDPVMALGADELEEALKRLMADLLVWRERGARVLRWKHLVDEKLRLDVACKAVLAELLLRGPQTPGELRGRSVRMHSFGGLGEVEGVLTELAARSLVAELPRAPGQKERRWRHLLGQEPAAGRGGAAEGEPAARRLFAGPPRPGEPATPARPPAAAGGSSGAPGVIQQPASVRPFGHAGPAAAPDRAPAGSGAAGGPAPSAGAVATVPAAAPASAVTPSQMAMERRLTVLEERLAEVLVRLARLEEGAER